MFKIYIGNLDKRTTAEHVRRLFVTFPDLDDLVLVVDPETGLSRCFAIAMFRDAERGRLAINALSGRRLHGRPLTVAEALNKKAKKAREAELDAAGAADGPGSGRAPGPLGGRPGSSAFSSGSSSGGGSSSGATGGGDAPREVRRPGHRPWHRSGGGGRPFGGSSTGGPSPGPGSGPSSPRR
ncbi:MAG: RNA-binding protein [Planctomycetota bacterium]|nr:RNA-binding protein [Planctomycetota bacterium]MDA1106302.1 RNA-binding protein [Planctomycetota bacterium]